MFSWDPKRRFLDFYAILAGAFFAPWCQRLVPAPNRCAPPRIRNLARWPRAIHLLCAIAGFLAGSGLTPAQSVSRSDGLILIHGRVHTMNAEQPMAEGIVIRDGRIVAVGSTAEILPHRRPGDEVLDVQGRVIVPGFNDSHVHFVSGGNQLSCVDLRDAKSQAEVADRLAQFASSRSKGAWITGGDWDHENWPGAPLPKRQDIDAATPDHPVYINRLDGHMALANSLALQLAGVTRDTEDPPGGLIVRDSTGEPTGVLKDAAMGLVAAHVPEMTLADRITAARAATNHAAQLGVTSVQDMSGSNDVLAYQELLKQGELKTRIYVAAPLPQWTRSAQAKLQAATGTAWLRQGGLKGFADGSLGSTTALFFDPYLDAPDTRGLPSDEMVRDGTMLERVRGADKAGLQLMIHAIGDRANDQILTIYETVSAENGERDRRFRIEHAQHLRREDIPRFGRGRIIASMQPYHCADDGRWAEKRIGSDRARGTYAFRALLDSNALLAFGTDWNVAPLNPMLGIAAAVTRRTLDGKHPDGWVPEQKITVDEAVAAYTVGSAFAEFQEHDKGMIAAGMLADLVVLSQDIFTIPPVEIPATRVLLTVVDGKVVHRDKDF